MFSGAVANVRKTLQTNLTRVHLQHYKQWKVQHILASFKTLLTVLYSS